MHCQVRTIEEAEQHIDSLTVRVEELERLVHDLYEWVDTKWQTPWWKRVLFWIDGWPNTAIVSAPAHRPWRRWWRS